MRGFVLVELLIVIAILSVVFFYVIPNVTDVFSAKYDPDVRELNRAVNIAYKVALSSNTPEMIWGVKGSDVVHFGDKTFHLSGDVFDARVNNRFQRGIKYYFFVYPYGVVDSVKLTFYGGREVDSSPLLLRFEDEH